MIITRSQNDFFLAISHKQIVTQFLEFKRKKIVSTPSSCFYMVFTVSIEDLFNFISNRE